MRNVLIVLVNIGMTIGICSVLAGIILCMGAEGIEDMEYFDQVLWTSAGLIFGGVLLTYVLSLANTELHRCNINKWTD